MARLKEIETVEPIDEVPLGGMSSSSGRTLQERRCSLVTRKPGGRAPRLWAKATGRREQNDRMALYPPAGYQRRHDEKGKTSTGEALLTPGRNSLRMVGHIAAMGNWLKSERVTEWIVVPNASPRQHNLARGKDPNQEENFLSTKEVGQA